MSNYYFDREQEWMDAEEAQLRALGLDEESQHRDDPEWWIEKDGWEED